MCIPALHYSASVCKLRLKALHLDGGLVPARLCQIVGRLHSDPLSGVAPNALERRMATSGDTPAWPLINQTRKRRTAHSQNLRAFRNRQVKRLKTVEPNREARVCRVFHEYAPSATLLVEHRFPLTLTFDVKRCQWLFELCQSAQ